MQYTLSMMMHQQAEEKTHHSEQFSEGLQIIEEQRSKQNAINVDDLFEARVLSNKNCFWSLLQSQTDRMHHYYYQQEIYIIQKLSALDKASLLTLDLLEQLREDELWLQEFVTFNVHLFELAVSKFDVEHHVNTYEEEMRYFEETSSFTNGERLTQILDAIEAYEFDILQEPSKKRHLVKSSKQEGICKSSILERSKSDRERSKDTMRRLSSFHKESEKSNKSKCKRKGSISDKAASLLQFFVNLRK
ncbi:predicted protein [Chaetoceros tenuissimus]|uniref:Uncharacterized protein n=1 Tax=Chaetoceros tenuissimus TaxID=426638 RepID=A0AAD3DDZ1_9STRA|nr:predicted protein [Chaetoceros tenuissimus]